jgi:hypothetical protein
LTFALFLISLGRLFHLSQTRTLKKFFLMSNLAVGKKSIVQNSVSDPDSAWIRIEFGRLDPDPDPDPGGQKDPQK